MIRFLLIGLFLSSCDATSRVESCHEHTQSPLNVMGYTKEYTYHKDYDQAFACAEDQNKPLLIFFTNDLPTGNRNREWKILLEKEIKSEIESRFVFVVLNTMDTMSLSQLEFEDAAARSIGLRTLGEKNMKIEIEQFNNNAQPMYVIIDKFKTIKSGPIYLSTDKVQFSRFLLSGR